MWHERLLLSLTQTLFHGLFDTRQTCTVLVFCKLTDTTHATVTQMVNVIDFAVAVPQINQNLDHSQNIFIGQNHVACRIRTPDSCIELHAANTRQIVCVRVIEQALEQGLHRVFCWRFAGTHHSINGNPRSKLIHCFVNSQCLRNVRTLIQFVGVNARQILNTCGAQLFQQGFCQLFVGFGQNFSGVSIHKTASDNATDQEIFRNTDVCCARLLKFAGVTNGNPLVFGHDHFARLVRDVKASNFTAQTLSNKLHLSATVHQTEIVIDKEVGKNRFWVKTNCLEQDRHRHLTPAVDAKIQDVFRVKFKVEP